MEIVPRAKEPIPPLKKVLQETRNRDLASAIAAAIRRIDPETFQAMDLPDYL